MFQCLVCSYGVTCILYEFQCVRVDENPDFDHRNVKSYEQLNCFINYLRIDDICSTCSASLRTEFSFSICLYSVEVFLSNSATFSNSNWITASPPLSCLSRIPSLSQSFQFSLPFSISASLSLSFTYALSVPPFQSFSPVNTPRFLSFVAYISLTPVGLYVPLGLYGLWTVPWDFPLKSPLLSLITLAHRAERRQSAIAAESESVSESFSLSSLRSPISDH